MQCESCDSAVPCDFTLQRQAEQYEMPAGWLLITFTPVRGAQSLHFCSMACALVWLAKRISEGPKDVVQPCVSEASYERP